MVKIVLVGTGKCLHALGLRGAVHMNDLLNRTGAQASQSVAGV